MSAAYINLASQTKHDQVTSKIAREHSAKDHRGICGYRGVSETTDNRLLSTWCAGSQDRRKDYSGSTDFRFAENISYRCARHRILEGVSLDD